MGLANGKDATAHVPEDTETASVTVTDPEHQATHWTEWNANVESLLVFEGYAHCNHMPYWLPCFICEALA